MKILVTGGAGFIGSHVVDAYLDSGHEVVIVDDLSTGFLQNVNPRTTFYDLDICSPGLDEVFAAVHPDLVNHHAAQISVPISVANPAMDAEINVKGFLNILQSCVKHDVKKVIFSSSGGAIYGEAEEYPSSETCSTKPLSPYAIHKLTAEYYLYFFKHQYGLEYTILRYANVYGPRQVSHGEAGVVSLYIAKLLAGQAGHVYAFEGEPLGMIRDYVYVKDVVQANLAALEKGNGEIFNIGTGVETPTRDLYFEIAGLLGVVIDPILGPARPGDLHRSLLKIEKAIQYLNWKPQYTLAKGIAETIDYFKAGNRGQE